MDLTQVLGIAQQRLGTPINSVLGDEISVSQRTSRGLVFECTNNKQHAKRQKKSVIDQQVSVHRKYLSNAGFYQRQREPSAGEDSHRISEAGEPGEDDARPFDGETLTARQDAFYHDSTDYDNPTFEADTATIGSHGQTRRETTLPGTRRQTRNLGTAHNQIEIKDTNSSIN